MVIVFGSSIRSLSRITFWFAIGDEESVVLGSLGAADASRVRRWHLQGKVIKEVIKVSIEIKRCKINVQNSRKHTAFVIVLINE